jgi:hypothetical protein
MFFLFCQPGLKNNNTIDFLIKKLLIKGLKISKENFYEINSFDKKGNKTIRLIPFSKKIDMLKDAFNFYTKTSKVINKKEFTHIFLDSYTILDLFFFSLLKFPKNIKIVVYLRIPYDFLFLTKLIFLLSIIILKKKNIKFITDTFELKNHFKKKYKIFCKVIPIPSDIKNYSKLMKFKLRKIKIIFPGKSRNEKGIKSIISLFKDKDIKINIDFIFLRNELIIKNLKKVAKLKLIPLRSNLPYKNYLNSLRNSHYIILPYSHKTYRLRSSGIFIDTIKLNKFCFVSKDTWMASILKKYNLDLFIINKWEMNELSKKIYYLNKNFIEIKKNFTKMRHDINKNNSDKRFIDKMKKVFVNS